MGVVLKEHCLAGSIPEELGGLLHSIPHGHVPGAGKESHYFLNRSIHDGIDGPPTSGELAYAARYPDLFVANSGSANELWHNEGDGTFTPVQGDVASVNDPNACVCPRDAHAP